jgi:hypothetical protein
MKDSPDQTASRQKSWQHHVRHGIRWLDKKVSPVARVMADVGDVIASFDGTLSPISAVTGVSRAIATASDWAESRDSLPVSGKNLFYSTSIQLETCALDALCDRSGRGEDHDFWAFDDYNIIACRRERITFYSTMDSIDDKPTDLPDRHALQALKLAIMDHIRNAFPVRLEIAIDDDDPERSIIKELDFKPISSPRGDEILDMVRAMVSEPDYKSILLEGPPGTGKTVMSHYLADSLAPTGRILSLRYDLKYMNSEIVKELCEILSPDIILIDDIDKLEDDLPNTVLEELRIGSNTLVILTANNAFVPGVLDGSLMRPGRIDESFEIRDIGVEIKNPVWMKDLDPDVRAEILSWPVAAQQSVENRFQRRGVSGLNLEELRKRLDLDVVSGGRIYRGGDSEQDEEWDD